MSKSHKGSASSRVRKVNKTQKSTSYPSPSVEQQQEPSKDLGSELLHYLREVSQRLDRLENALVNLQSGAIQTDSRSWVTYLLLCDVVGGSIKTTDDLGKATEKLAYQYSERFRAEQEAAAKGLTPTEFTYTPRSSDSDEIKEIVLGG